MVGFKPFARRIVICVVFLWIGGFLFLSFFETSESSWNLTTQTVRRKFQIAFPNILPDAIRDIPAKHGLSSSHEQLDLAKEKQQEMEIIISKAIQHPSTTIHVPTYTRRPAPDPAIPSLSHIKGTLIDEKSEIFFFNAWKLAGFEAAAILLAVPTEEVAISISCSDAIPAQLLDDSLFMNKSLYSTHDKWNQYLVVLLRCPLLKRNNNSTLNHLQETLHSQIRLHGIAKPFEVPVSAPNPGNHKVGSCVAQIRGNAAVHIPEWIEYHHRLGIEHFTMYLANHASIELVRTLQYYREIGIVDVVEWDSETSDLTHNHNQVLTYNDCMYRNGERYTYTTFHDIDEFIKFIEANKTTNGEPRSMAELVEKNHTGYIFEESTFRAECPKDDTIENKERHPLLNFILQRPTNNPPKTVLQTKAGIMMGVHQPYWPDQDSLHTIPEWAAALYHFRNLPGFLKEYPCNSSRDIDSETFINTILVDDGLAIKEAVDKAWSWIDIGPLE